MPFYEIVPAVDEDYNFPPAVRGALAQSAEILDVINNQLFRFEGVWDASNNIPELNDADVLDVAAYYQVSIPGTQDLGSGDLTFAAGDYIVYDNGQWEKVAGASLDSTPWFIDIHPMTPPSDPGGWDLAADPASLGNGYRYSMVQNDELHYVVLLGAGVWECSAVVNTTNAGGIVTVEGDYTHEGIIQSVAALDTYSATTVPNVELVAASTFTVPHVQAIDFAVVSRTKNASSAAYWAFIQSLSFRRVS